MIKHLIIDKYTELKNEDYDLVQIVGSNVSAVKINNCNINKIISRVRNSSVALGIANCPNINSIEIENGGLDVRGSDSDKPQMIGSISIKRCDKIHLTRCHVNRLITGEESKYNIRVDIASHIGYASLSGVNININIDGHNVKTGIIDVNSSNHCVVKLEGLPKIERLNIKSNNTYIESLDTFSDINIVCGNIVRNDYSLYNRKLEITSRTRLDYINEEFDEIAFRFRGRLLVKDGGELRVKSLYNSDINTKIFEFEGKAKLFIEELLYDRGKYWNYGSDVEIYAIYNSQPHYKLITDGARVKFVGDIPEDVLKRDRITKMLGASLFKMLIHSDNKKKFNNVTMRVDGIKANDFILRNCRLIRGGYLGEDIDLKYEEYRVIEFLRMFKQELPENSRRHQAFGKEVKFLKFDDIIAMAYKEIILASARVGDILVDGDYITEQTLEIGEILSKIKEYSEDGGLVIEGVLSYNHRDVNKAIEIIKSIYSDDSTTFNLIDMDNDIKYIPKNKGWIKIVGDYDGFVVENICSGKN